MRLDIFLTQKGHASSRTKAQNLITEGYVFVNGNVVDKPSFQIGENDQVTIKQHDRYVSRGAYKLLGATDKFNLNFSEKIVLDMGASTGGFTQVALEKGAKKVFAVDIGKSQLDESLKNNSKVVCLENTDIRNVDKDMVGDVDLIIGDLSFISLEKVLPHLKQVFGAKEMAILFKPQFECGRDLARKYKGVVKDKVVHKNLLKNFILFCQNLGFLVSDLTASPIKGGDGNIEYLVHLNGEIQNYNLEKIVEEAFKKEDN